MNTHILRENNGLIDTKGERSRVALRWNEGSATKYVAGVVELGDTLGLGPSGLIAVGVRVPPPAPKDNISRVLLEVDEINLERGPETILPIS